jgi:hypothetical protein
MTYCNDTQLLFQDLGRRHVVARFNRGPVTSDAGGLLLREVEAKFHFIDQFATCFTDHRYPDWVEHTLSELLKQGIFALCLGYESWSRERRVVAKAEHLAKGPNPRFIVSSLTAAAFAGPALYEQEYCGRGDRENRIKEQQLMLFANRVSCQTMRAHQVRLCLATVAYIVLRALRQYGLAETELAQAQGDTIRVKLLKIGAVIGVHVRRVTVALSEA